MKVLTTTLISLVAAAALLVPAAGAGTRPDDRNGVRGPGAQLWLDPSIATVVAEQSESMWIDPSIANAVADSSKGDFWVDPAIAEAVRVATATSVRPDDRAGRREAPLVETATEPGGSTSRVDWSDAGMGAALVFVALVAAGIMLGRHGRRELEHA